MSQYKNEYIDEVCKELENRGWQFDSNGDPECYDEASAAGADIIRFLQKDLRQEEILHEREEVLRGEALKEKQQALDHVKELSNSLWARGEEIVELKQKWLDTEARLQYALTRQDELVEQCAVIAETYLGYTGAGYCDIKSPDHDISMEHDYGRGASHVKHNIAEEIRKQKK